MTFKESKVKLNRANLKNVVAAFRKGGVQLITRKEVLPAALWFLPMKAYEDGQFKFDECAGPLHRHEFNSMSRKAVKQLIHDRFNNHFIMF